MKFVVIGLTPDGRSRVAEARDVVAGLTPRSPGVDINRVWTTSGLPPELPPRPDPGARRMDVGLAPGATRWTIFRLDPGSSDHLHQTDTLDYDLVLSGEVTLGLEEGAVTLRPGDGVMIPGLMHNWTAGPEGCIVSAIMTGLNPSA